MKIESVRLTAGTDREALEELAAHAAEKGYVVTGYREALLEREAAYPTGLDVPTAEFGIAIPHADPDYVTEQAVLLGLPEAPVEFASMDDPERSVAAEVVVLLLVTDEEGYATFLSNLVQLFRDDDFVAMVRSGDGDGLLDLIVERCG